MNKLGYLRPHKCKEKIVGCLPVLPLFQIMYATGFLVGSCSVTLLILLCVAVFPPSFDGLLLFQKQEEVLLIPSA